MFVLLLSALTLHPTLPHRHASITLLAKGTPKPTRGVGFGAAKPAPPTLQDVCGAMPKRLPKDFSAPCACGLGETYSACCRPYHTYEKGAETAAACLRARYSAYAYRLVEYVIASTDRSSSAYMKDDIKWANKLSKASMFDRYTFVKLEVGESEAGSPENGAPVEYLGPNTFTVQSKDKMGEPPITTAERTKFVRRKGVWRFAEGANL